MAYFTRTGAHRFLASHHVGGAWSLEEQHIGPALGLLLHCVERDRDARRDDGMVVGRLSYDILGTLPVDEVEVAVEVLRPGRTIELVEARLVHAGRPAVLLRAWLLRPTDTAPLAASSLEPIPAPEDLEPWDPTTVWPGGFIASADVRRWQREPGRAAFWARPRVPLVADEEVSPLARAAGLVDIANGMTVRADPGEVAFPNVDLTAHLVREPHGDWIGFDTTVSFGPRGLGLTSSVLHDEEGPLGTMAQVLTLRPR
jgi:hypothetical protein